MKIFFALAVLTIGLVQSEVIIPTPMFVTGKDINADAGETKHFYARLCGGCLYDRSTARISINQVNKPWDQEAGSFEIVKVTDDSGNLLQTNKLPGNKYASEFTFEYLKAYGDLFLEVKTGDATGGSQYTVTLEFINRPPCKPCETAGSPPIKEVGANEAIPLVVVFRTNKVNHVTTQNKLWLRLDYCFPINQPGKISISTIATDTISGFGTYVCKGPGAVEECTAQSPDAVVDTSGASVNFVDVELSGKGGDLEPIRVMIYGDGNNLSKNSFRLGASKFFPK